MNLPVLKKQYLEEVLPLLMKDMGFKNRLEVPAIKKIVINSGIKATEDTKTRVKEVVEIIRLISGQAPVVTKARTSISNFKLREGMPVGVMVTLRGSNMWEFLLRFVSIALPNTRDFRGLSPSSFDGRGNYTVGITDSTIFPEVTSEGSQKVVGMDITIVTTARNDNDARELLQRMGVPFRAKK